MDLRHRFHREPELPPIPEEEWAPIAAALRAMPDIAAPRDFRLSFEQAARLRRRSWRERLAIPAPLAAGVAAMLLVVAMAPALLSGLGAAGDAGVTTSAPGDFLFAPAERSAADAGAATAPVPAVGPKAIDSCIQASPSPSPTGSTTVPAGTTPSPSPSPVCAP